MKNPSDLAKPQVHRAAPVLPRATAGSRRLQPRRIVLALALAGVASHVLLPGGNQARAQTLPSGLNVTQGQAAVSVAGSKMTVTNSNGAVLQWQNFSIGSGNTVRFDQPSTTSRVLNQVVGANPSNIFGNLSSNGEVWLVNPYGVLFGRDARVDVGSLVVSTLAINADAWANRRLSLASGSTSDGNLASIVNQGELRTSTGGRVLLLAGEGGVRNEGLIAAPDGQVVLAAGQSVDLVDTGTQNVAVRVTAPQGEVRNLGSIAVGGGRVDLWAAMVNQDGIVQADSIAGRGGDIVLRASDTLNTGAGSVTSASGSAGGSVTLDSGSSGTTLVAGTVAATGTAGSGGSVQALGMHVGLIGTASIDGSGGSGGGEVLVGGGAQGKDPAVPNSQAVYMGPAAAIRADATVAGDGGHIVLWSDQATRAYGSLSARGGPAGGNGGLIETSGGWLDARPASLRTDAPKGKRGTWLLDPNNLFIVDGGSDSNIFGSGPDFATTGDSAFLTTGTITSVLNTGSNLNVTTSSGGTQAGDITMLAAKIIANPDGAPTLTLNAARNILIQSSTITASSGSIGLTLNAANGTSGTGTIQIDNSTIQTFGGNILLTGGTTVPGPGTSTSPFAGAVGYDGNGVGISITRSLIDAGTGRISAYGISTAASGVSGLAHGVSVSGGSTLTANDIDLHGWVYTNSDIVDRAGVVVDSGSSVTASVSLLLNGTVLSDSLSGKGFDGVRIGGSVAVSNSEPAGGSFLEIDGSATGAATSGVDSVNLAYPGVIDASGALAASINGVRDMSLQSTIYASSGGTTSIVNSDTASGQILSGGQIYGSPGSLVISGTVVSGYDYVSLSGSANLTITADRYAPYGSLSAPGMVSVLANTIDLPLGFSISSGASGDAIVIAGQGGVGHTNAQHFINNAGSSLFTLTGTGARWLIYATDPKDTANYNAGGLNYDATVYAAPFGSSFTAGSFTATGNLQLFTVAPALGPTSGSPISRAYDGTQTVDVSGQIAGLYNGDKLYGTFADKNVGTGKTITLFPTSTAPDIRDLSGKPVFGYTRTTPGPFTLTGSINAKTITLVGVVAASKVYDGTLAAAVSGGTLSGLVPSESLTLTLGPGSFLTKNVGTGITVTGGASLADGAGGGLASNYSLASGGYSTTASITPAAITSVSGITASNKVYDSTTTATLNAGAAVFTGKIGADTLTVATENGTFANKNVGTAKTVNISGITLGGADAGNYTLSSSTATTTANITPATVAVAGITANDKTYDGTTAATLNTASAAFTGEFSGDALTVSGASGAFTTKAAGTAKTVNISAITLAGADAGNYTVGGGTVTTTASIAKATIAGVTGITAAGKIYDGTTAATLTTGGAAFTGEITGDSLTVAGATGAFANKNAGTGKAVSISGITLGGADAGNYTLASSTATASADIAQRGIGVASASMASKVYDGTTSATITGWTLGGAVAGDVVSVAAGSGTFNSAGASTASAGTATATALGGSDAGNYVLTAPTVATVAAITPATLTYIATPAVSRIGSVPTGLSGTVGGFVAGETQSSATTGSLLFTTPADATSPVGTYAINGSGLTAANYSFVQAPGNATALTLVFGAVSPATSVPAEVLKPEQIKTSAVLPLPVDVTGFATRTMDVLQAVTIDASGGSAFGPLDLDSLTQDAIAALLEARNRYKRSLFDGAIRRLEEDPNLADAPSCETAAQSASGVCLVTDEQLAQLHGEATPAATTAAPTDLGPPQPPVAPPITPSGPLLPPSPAAPPAAPPPVAATAPALPPGASAPGTPAPALVPALIVAANARPQAQPTLKAPPLPLARPVRAASLPQIQRKFAVLIGDDNYADQRIPQLDNAGRDALAVASVLENKLGYDTLVMRDASREAIIGMLNKLAIEARPSDSVLIYYAGHGELVDKTNLGYWIPANADPERPETWISNNDIDKLIGRIRASQVVLVSDSCFSGSLVSNQPVLKAGERTVDPQIVLKERASVVMSSGGNEPVADGSRNGHSPFATALMANLEVPTWRIGSQVFDNVRSDVAKRLPQRPQYGTVKQGRHTVGADYLFENRQLDGATP